MDSAAAEWTEKIRGVDVDVDNEGREPVKRGVGVSAFGVADGACLVSVVDGCITWGRFEVEGCSVQAREVAEGTIKVANGTRTRRW